MPTIDPATTIEVWNIKHYMASSTGRIGSKVHVCTKPASEIFGIQEAKPVKYYKDLGPNDTAVVCNTDLLHFHDTELLSLDEFQKRTATIPEHTEEEYLKWLETVCAELKEILKRD